MSISSSSGSGSFWAPFFLNNREVSGLAIIVIYLAIMTIFAFILYPYISKIYRDERTFMTPVTDRVYKYVSKVLGPIAGKDMKFKEYFVSLLSFSFFAGIVSFVLLYYQTFLPLIGGGQQFSPSLAVNTVVSFLTNTDIQHYSSPLQLSYFSQTFIFIGLLYIAPISGFAASMAFVRGILTDKGHLGNFFRDFTRGLVELFIPLTLLLTLILVLAGVPETVTHYLNARLPFSTNLMQIPLGPVASWDAIEQLGTNGGGFYSANLAFPLANPGWFTNLVLFTSETIIPFASLLAMGKVFENKKFGNLLFGVVMIIFVFVVLLTYFSEYSGIPSMQNIAGIFTGNMSGKETRFGISQSILLNVASTMTSTGAVNSALIDYTPTGMLGVLTGLLLNDPLGGIGTSVMNIFMFVIFTAFLVSLMVGKLPEIMGIKLGSKEIRYSTLTIITHPLIILVPFGVAILIPSIMSLFINSHAQNITTLLYEFGSAASNNGSEIGGFNFTAFFNYVDAATMLLGRFLIIGLELLIAQAFSVKKARGESSNAIQIGSVNFGMMMLFVIIFMGILSFFPILVLGPFFSFAKDFSLVMFP